MKKKKTNRILALIIAFVMTLLIIPSNAIFADNTAEDLGTRLIPLPLEYYTTGGDFVLDKDTEFFAVGNNDAETNELYNTGELLARRFRTSTGFALPVSKGEPTAGNYILLTTVGGDSEFGIEGYELIVKDNSITITSFAPTGAYMGTQTLRQLFPSKIEAQRVQKNTKWTAPCSEIRDKPEYDYRSTQLDVGRHFFSVDEVKRHIDNIAQYKINKLHLHLTEDQGWRIEIKGGRYGEDYSALTEIGGSTCVHYITEADGSCLGKGGYYTQEDFKEIVAYAAERYVEIVPEVDMPGHTNAALASLAFLNPNGIKKNLYTGINVGFSTFDCNAESTYEFIEDVISQIAAISPSKYFHVGGDEASATPAGDYKKFVNRVTEICKKYNKIPIGWSNYDRQVDDKDYAIGQYWSSGNGSGSNLNNGGGIKYVLSPASYAYVDMKYPNDNSSGLGLSWAGTISIQKSYEWDPTTWGPKELVIGVEAPLWAETIRLPEHIDHMVFPRLLGIAEIGWTPKANRNFTEYKERLLFNGERMDFEGIKYYKDPTYAWEDVTWIGDKLTSTNSVIKNINGLSTGPVTVSGNTFSISNVNNISMGYNRFIGMKLNNTYLTNSVEVSLSAGVFDKVEVQYSINGVEWTTLTGTLTENVFAASLNAAPARYIRVINTSNEEVDFDLVSFNVVKEKSTVPSIGNIATNAGIYQSYYVTNLVDGNFTTSYWTSLAQAAGQTVTITYAEPLELYDFALYEDTGDYIRTGSIYASEDGTEWTKISAVGSNYTLESKEGTGFNVIRGNANGMTMKYIRIVTEGSANYWTKLWEFEVNQTVESVTGIMNPFNSVANGNPSNVLDMNDKTAFITTSDEGFLNYRLTEYVGASDLVIVQNANNISDAKVSIRTSLGWSEIGTLSVAYNEFDLTAYPDILEVKLEWQNNGVTPNIIHIFTVSEAADFTHLNARIDAAKEILANAEVGSSEYILVQDAINLAEAVADNTSATRGMIAGAIATVNEAIAADTYALQKLADECLLCPEGLYTRDSWAPFAAALDSAIAVLEDIESSQAQVDAAYSNLVNAINNLVSPKKEILLDFIKEADALVGSDEYNKTYAFIRDYFDTSLAAAKAVYNDITATDNDVSDAIDDLVDAIHYLAAQPADHAKLEILVDLAHGLDLTRYNVGVAAFETALANAGTVLADIFATQDEADTAYTALLKAITAMRYEVDKSKLQDLYNKVNGVNTALYTDESVVVFLVAFAHAEKVLNAPYATQDEVNTAHDDLKTTELNLKLKSTGTTSAPSSTDGAGTSNTAGNSEGASGTTSVPKTADSQACIMLIALPAAGCFAVLFFRKKGLCKAITKVLR